MLGINQRCRQIKISRIWELLGSFFLRTFDHSRKVLCYFLKKSGAFPKLFLDAFDKYVEILCYYWQLFQRFGRIWKLFRAFLTNFKRSTEILCYFLCYFLRTPKFGRSPKIPELATPLGSMLYYLSVWCVPFENLERGGLSHLFKFCLQPGVFDPQLLTLPLDIWISMKYGYWALGWTNTTEK